MKRVYLLFILTSVFMKSYSNIDGQNQGNYYMNMHNNKNNFTGQNATPNTGHSNGNFTGQNAGHSNGNFNTTPNTGHSNGNFTGQNAGHSNGNKLPKYFLELSDEQQKEVLNQDYDKEDLKKMLLCIRLREQKGCFWNYLSALLFLGVGIFMGCGVFYHIVNKGHYNICDFDKLGMPFFSLIASLTVLCYIGCNIYSIKKENTAYENQAKYKIYKKRMKVNINA